MHVSRHSEAKQRSTNGVRTLRGQNVRKQQRSVPQDKNTQKQLDGEATPTKEEETAVGGERSIIKVHEGGFRLGRSTERRGGGAPARQEARVERRRRVPTLVRRCTIPLPEGGTLRDRAAPAGQASARAGPRHTRTRTPRQAWARARRRRARRPRRDTRACAAGQRARRRRKRNGRDG
jgi:hypothetical protein